METGFGETPLDRFIERTDRRWNVKTGRKFGISTVNPTERMAQRSIMPMEIWNGGGMGKYID
jgi:hypothetical protein